MDAALAAAALAVVLLSLSARFASTAEEPLLGSRAEADCGRCARCLSEVLLLFASRAVVVVVVAGSRWVPRGSCEISGCHVPTSSGPCRAPFLRAAAAAYSGARALPGRC